MQAAEKLPTSIKEKGPLQRQTKQCAFYPS